MIDAHRFLKSLPPDVVQDQQGHDEETGAHDDELKEVRHQHREHTAEDRVDRDEEEEDAHHEDEVIRIPPTDRTEKVTADLEEDPHIKQSTEDDDDAGEPADPFAEAILKKLRQRHRTGGPERLHAEAGEANHEHGEGLADPGSGSGEALCVTRLSGIHAGDDPELGRRERGDPEVEIHLAPGDEEMLDLRDVAPHPDPGDHRAEQIKPDDAAVDPGVEMGHVGGNPRALT